MSIFEIMLSPGHMLDFDKQLYVYNNVVLRNKNYRALELLCEVPNFDSRIEDLMAGSTDYHVLKMWASLPSRTSAELKSLVLNEKRVTVLKEIAAIAGLDSAIYELLAAKDMPVVSAYLLTNPTLSDVSAKRAFNTVFSKTSIFANRFKIRGLKAATYYTETASIVSMWPEFLADFISSGDSEGLLLDALGEYSASTVASFLSSHGAGDEFFLNVLYPAMSKPELPAKVVSFYANRSYYRYSSGNSGSNPKTIAATVASKFLKEYFANSSGLASQEASDKALELFSSSETGSFWWDSARLDFSSFIHKPVVNSQVATLAVLSRIKDMSVDINDLIEEVLDLKSSDAALKVMRRSDITVQQMGKILASGFVQRISFGGLSRANAVKLALARSRNPTSGWTYLDFDSRAFYRELFFQAQLSGYAVPYHMVSLRYFKPDDIAFVSARVLTDADAPMVLRQAAADFIYGSFSEPAAWVELEELASRTPNMQLGQLVACVKDLSL